MASDYKKSFLLHYNFPPYCVGEVGRIGFTNRREIGHGHLAERSLKPILPHLKNFLTQFVLFQKLQNQTVPHQWRQFVVDL